jgi:hypothetical protein
MNTTQYSTDEIRQAIEQGSITAEYHADPRQLLSELNQLGRRRLQAIYNKQHAYMAVSLFAQSQPDFQAHANIELQHATC